MPTNVDTYEVLRLLARREAVRLTQSEHQAAHVPDAALRSAEIRVQRRAAAALLAGTLTAFQGTGRLHEYRELDEVQDRDFFEAIDAWLLSHERQSRAAVYADFSGLPISAGSRAVVAELERLFAAPIASVLSATVSGHAPVATASFRVPAGAGASSLDGWLDVLVRSDWSAIEPDKTCSTGLTPMGEAALSGKALREELRRRAESEYWLNWKPGGRETKLEVVAAFVMEQAKLLGQPVTPSAAKQIARDAKPEGANVTGGLQPNRR